jgi:hypothetical protein
MRQFAVLSVVILSCAFALGQGVGMGMAPDTLAFQQPLPPVPPPPGAGNVVFRTEKIGDKVTMAYFAVSDAGKTVTGAPYSATATTETTQVLADGNRIVNKTETIIARDGQGRTRREETMSNVGPLATNAPRTAFITDTVAKASYILDLNHKTADVIKLPALPAGAGPEVNDVKIIHAKPGSAGQTVNVEKRVIVGGSPATVEQRVWVNTADDPAQLKTESLGNQTIEGVQAEGTRTTRTIPAGQIGNERAIEITSEVWTSPELQTIVMSKRNDPRFGETVYKLTDIRRAEPDPLLFQVPSGFTTKGEPE